MNRIQKTASDYKRNEQFITEFLNSLSPDTILKMASDISKNEKYKEETYEALSYGLDDGPPYNKYINSDLLTNAASQIIAYFMSRIISEAFELNVE